MKLIPLPANRVILKGTLVIEGQDGGFAIVVENCKPWIDPMIPIQPLGKIHSFDPDGPTIHISDVFSAQASHIKKELKRLKREYRAEEKRLNKLLLLARNNKSLR